MTPGPRQSSSPLAAIGALVLLFVFAVVPLAVCAFVAGLCAHLGWGVVG